MYKNNILSGMYTYIFYHNVKINGTFWKKMWQYIASIPECIATFISKSTENLNIMQ